MTIPLNKGQARGVIKDFKLNSLLEITKAINHNFSTDELLKIFEETLKNHLNIGRLVLFGFDGSWNCLLTYGPTDGYDSIDIERDLVPIKEISTKTFFSQKDNSKNFEIIIPVYHKSHPLAYLLIGDLDEEKFEVSPTIKHLPFIQTLTNIIVVAIENKKLAKESILQAGIKKELELASQMQSLLFPSSLPHDEILETSAFYLPHQEVGGDYYDFIKLNKNEIVFCMADVSGKGVSAALLMSNFQANLRAIINTTTSLTDLVRELNSKVIASAKGEKFITFFIAKYNLVTRVLNYVNAAHNPPLLANGKSVSLLKIGCTGLGMFDELPKIKEGIINITPNTSILCYTDGLVELENEKGEDYGIDALKELIKNNMNLGMKEINQLIIGQLVIYKGKKPYIDDIALFGCRIF